VSALSKRGRRDRDEAKAYLAELLAAIRQGRFGQSVGQVTPFSELVELLRSDYLRRGLRSWDRAERAIAHLRPAFGSLTATAITFARINAYVTGRIQEGARAGTIHAEIAALGRMLRLALAADLIPSLPVFPSLPPSPAREGFLTSGQVDAVVANLKQPVADLVYTLWITGWRRREIQFLRWDDVNMEAGEIRLTAARSKTRVARVFPFAASRSLAAIVKARFAARSASSAYLFERSPGEPVKDFREAWRRACEKAGVPGRVPHDLRRSRARALTRAHVPQSVAMRLLGHKTANMFLRYDVAATEDLAEAVAAAETPTKRAREALESAAGASTDEGAVE
jgi:integrase